MPVDADKIPERMLGVFWASYLHTPREPGFHFPAAGSSRNLTSIYDALEHTHGGVIAPEDGPVGAVADSDAEKRVVWGVQRTRYAKPFYCGAVNGMLLCLMFRPHEDVEIRFAFSASGGGPGVPAWDYQAVVGNPKPGKVYGFKTRVVYKPFSGLEEASRLYDEWQ